MKLKLTKEARADVEQNYTFYEEKSDVSAKGFIKELDGQFEKIKANPDRYPPMPNFPDWQRALMKKYPFVIVFKHLKLAKLIRIIAVWHQKRDLNRLGPRR